MFPLQQDPPSVAATAAESGLVQQFEAIGWVDQTALAVLLVFFVIGLFKGLIWQVSRIAILVCAYVIAGRFGHAVGAWLTASPANPALLDPALANPAGANPDAAMPTALPTLQPSETTLYLAYVLIFLGVLIVLSLLAMLLQKLANKAGLGFFDRLGGGVFGILTGACVVLFAQFVLHMFAPGSKLAAAAEASHSLRLSQRAIDWLGTHVHDDLRVVLALTPLDAAGAQQLLGEPSRGTNGVPAAGGPESTSGPAKPPLVPPGEPQAPRLPPKR